MSNAAQLASAALRSFRNFRRVGITHRAAWRKMWSRLDAALVGLYLVDREVAYEVLAAKLYAGYRVARHPAVVRASAIDAAASAVD